MIYDFYSSHLHSSKTIQQYFLFFLFFIAHAKFERKLIDESVFPHSIDFFCH